MKIFQLLALCACIALAACQQGETEADAAAKLDIFPAEASGKILIAPYKFEDKGEMCQCQYILKNTSDKTLQSFRSTVYVTNENGRFACDIGVMGDKVEAGETQILTNMTNAQKCGNVQSLEHYYNDRCSFKKGYGNDCSDEDLNFMNNAGISWTHDADSGEIISK
ncbi:hypothetical protein [Flexibacterium corallicola]|uniref:hypothetical protein n=1 Tax=Flexibacterium corallicola TaxID=3037259 RepID=UPI00286F96B1|nr:hypothetical protein [Pseudovibrio sp. M1P-2-3]